MATSQLRRAVQTLRQTALPPEAPGLSDAHLLGRFVEQRDETAFAVLVRRHAALVWGVCHRTVGHHHDAEDAFQATFLVLARRAASVRPRELLANWLYGVARRTALKARAAAVRRRQRERQLPALPERHTAPQDSPPGLETLVDRELAGLPEKYRLALLLCDLQGRTGKEAARQLKIPEGTLATRLRTARSLLAKRLTRRGLTLSAGAVAAAFSQAVLSAAPLAVVGSTIRSVTAAGTVSVPAAALAEGVMRTMMLTQCKTALAVVLVLGAMLTAGGVVAQPWRPFAGEGEGKRSQPAPAAAAGDAAAPAHGYRFVARVCRGDPLGSVEAGEVKVVGSISGSCVANSLGEPPWPVPRRGGFRIVQEKVREAEDGQIVPGYLMYTNFAPAGAGKIRLRLTLVHTGLTEDGEQETVTRTSYRRHDRVVKDGETVRLPFGSTADRATWLELRVEEDR